MGSRTLPPGTTATGITPDKKKRHVGLNNAVRLMPTPRPCSGERSSGMNRTELYRAMDRLLPTPHANCHTGAGTQGRDGGLKVQTAVQLLPTPTKADGDRGSNTYYRGQGNPTLRGAAGGTLNPQWVEWLMGYPEGWTDLEA